MRVPYQPAVPCDNPSVVAAAGLPPGGRIKPGEDPLSAARRELREETGLTADPHAPDPVLLDDWIDESSDGRIETYGLSYAFVVASATPLQGEPDQPARWFTLSGNPPDAHPRHWARVVEFAGTHRA